MSLLFSATAIGCAPSSRAAHTLPDYPATDSILIAPMEVSIDLRIPVGEIDGIVVDAYRGSVLSHAIVRVNYADTVKKTAAVVSDEGGRFRIIGVKPGPATLQFSYIGYHPENVPISGDSGLVVRGGLHAVAMRACGLLVNTGPRPAITVIVRDAQTGVAPTVPVMLRLSDGGYADSATASTSPSYTPDSLALGAAEQRNGSYDVRVTAPGYKTWQARDVRPPTSSCYGVEGRYLPVWLLPTSQTVKR
jgi:hypothetical protein